MGDLTLLWDGFPAALTPENLLYALHRRHARHRSSACCPASGPR